MRKFWFLAPACVLLFSLQVLAATRADSRSTKSKDDAETVELFDAIKSGDIEVRVIAKDATAGNVLIKNVTARRLAIKLPEAFAAVPVAAQFGGPLGGPFGGGPFVASVALHVIERLTAPSLLAQVRAHGEFVDATFRDLVARHPKVRTARGKGLIWGLDVADPASEVVARAREEGLLVVTAGDHTVRLLPPLVITHAELARGLAILERVL